MGAATAAGGTAAAAALLGGYLLLGVARELVRSGRGECRDRGQLLPSTAGRHGVRPYLKVRLVGGLLTLSPPVAMIAFLSGVGRLPPRGSSAKPGPDPSVN